MKRIILAVICILGFAGCSAAQVYEPAETTQSREPPNMILEYSIGDETVRETVGYTSAAWDNCEMDAGPAHPNIRKTESLEKITISFELAPDSFEEIRVNDRYVFDVLGKVEAAEYVLILPVEESKYVYMVRANWPQGRADYFFTVTVA